MKRHRTTTHVDVDLVSLCIDIPFGPCQNCGKREAECWWVGDGGMLAYAHGMKAAWCELCVCTAQLAAARRAAERLPELWMKQAELQRQPPGPNSMKKWVLIQAYLRGLHRLSGPRIMFTPDDPG